MAKVFSEIRNGIDNKVEKYNPYHGKDGRFTTGGGSKTTVPYKGGTSGAGASAGSSGSSSGHTISSSMDDNSPEGKKLHREAAATAKAAVAKASKAEKQITNDLDEIADITGSKLAGRDFRLKTEKSLTRKLVTECKEQSDKKNRDVHPDEAVKRMYDINRYTVMDDEEHLTATFMETKRRLEAKGYKVKRVKNTLGDTNVDYRGVNCVIETKDGTRFELQFHTKKSLEVKEVNHVMYEEERKDDTPPERKKQLKKQMSENARSIPTPKDIDAIKPFDDLAVKKSDSPYYMYYDKTLPYDYRR